MNRKKILIPVLVIFSLAIWAHNLFRIFRSFQQNREELVQEGSKEKDMKTMPVLSSLSGTPFVYPGDTRDPFQHWLRSPRKEKSSPQKPRQTIPRKDPVRLPRLRFSGVLKDHAGNLAMIEDPDGEIYFVRINNEVAGVKIVRITDREVECLYQKETFRLVLKP